jgi:hypothetical protein
MADAICQIGVSEVTYYRGAKNLAGLIKGLLAGRRAQDRVAPPAHGT